MSFTKSALLGSAAVLAVVAGAQAADLPSKKAAPASYVKICDAYGAGFFFIPGTDTCVKLGGYVRAEYNYTPGKDVYVVNGNILPLKASSASTTSVAVPAGMVYGGAVVPAGTGYYMVPAPTFANGLNAAPAQVGIAQTASATPETGYETRGRIDVDARTPTAMGAARTFVRLRAANVSGVRNLVSANNAIYTPADKSATGISIESAFVQWAGFTFGVAPENFSMMPSIMYNANPWTGFPNGMKQLSYTATFGGGISATVALEDRLDSFNGSGSGPVGSNYLDRPTTAANIVANLRLDQAWGFAAISGMIGNNSLTSNYGYNPNAFATASMTTSSLGAGILGYSNNYAANYASLPTQTIAAAGSGLVLGNTYGTNSAGQSTFNAYAVGGTVNFKLPMIAAGDQIWFSANYAHGMLGAILSGGSLNSLADASNHRITGGIIRVDQPLMITGGNGSMNNPYTVGTVNAWNIATVFTHYWAAQWRSNVSAGYVEIKTPTSTATATDSFGNVVSLPQWGKGRVWEVAASLIYSPAKDFDIGLELQYANLKNNIQNTAGAVCTLTSSTPCAVSTNTALSVPKNALESNNIAVKFRVERTF